MRSVAVVGAGISGLLAAYYTSKELPRSSIRVYEARNYIGKPHCTGLISTETLSRLPFAREYVLRSYRTLKVFIPEIKTSIDVLFEKESFVKIDRVKLEKRLHHELASTGVEVSLGNTVHGLFSADRRWLVYSKLGDAHIYDFLVLASGYGTKLAKTVGLRSRVGALSGVQVELGVGSRSSFSEDAVLVLLSRYFGGGFAWVVPVGDREVITGCATDPKVVESFKCLNIVLALVAKKFGGCRTLSQPYGGVVLRGYPISLYTEKAIGLGDSVAMVKSISGGGLYAISIASKLIPAFIMRKHYLLSSLRTLSRELRRHYYVARALTAFLNIAESIGIRNKYLEVSASRVSYDDHLALLLKMITSREVLAELVRRSSITYETRSAS
ncbi:MAG: NAD(P)/FAD-dependent oxidoreductase [Sulfolobales archaeon]|nr:NAD(P)/FAD-dependent oxidoreductase [Sulfolobales archaeon]